MGHRPCLVAGLQLRHPIAKAIIGFGIDPTTLLLLRLGLTAVQWLGGAFVVLSAALAVELKRRLRSET